MAQEISDVFNISQQQWEAGVLEKTGRWGRWSEYGQCVKIKRGGTEGVNGDRADWEVG